VDVVEELPLTPVGKADKKVLRARYWGDSRRGVN
jgi:non-ribosomal peptide synthetase component E (peptide arylation enzyme)